MGTRSLAKTHLAHLETLHRHYWHRLRQTFARKRTQSVIECRPTLDSPLPPHYP